MRDFKKELEDKWGKFEKTEYLMRQKKLIQLSEKHYLNKLYNPINIKEYSIVEDKLNCKLLPELIEFYKKYNGASLFSHSLVILGLNTFKLREDKIYGPIDFIRQNVMSSLSYKNHEYKDLIVFGYAGICLFCYNKKEFKKIYVIENKTNTIVHIFASFDECFNFYFDYLFNEYDNDGMKKHYVLEYENNPILRNISTEIL